MDDIIINIENEYKIKIIFLCEFGSRIQGNFYESSDYDVRGIYIHPEDTYLYSNILGNLKDDIITKIIISDKILDILLWDITKTLRLFYIARNQTPVLFIRSPIIYFKNNEKYTIFKNFIEKNNSYIFAYRHCFGKFISHLKYFLKNPIYVKHLAISIYKIFALEFILQNKNPSYPLNFNELSISIKPDRFTKDNLQNMISLHKDIVNYRSFNIQDNDKIQHFLIKANEINLELYPIYYTINNNFKKDNLYITKNLDTQDFYDIFINIIKI